jgi:hypothetical protein
MTTTHFSLCIPRVLQTITEQQIRKTFDELQLGIIHKIDIRQGDKEFNRAFIHFRKWHSSDNAAIAKERFKNGLDIKVIYDGTWFWKVMPFKVRAQ